MEQTFNPGAPVAAMPSNRQIRAAAKATLRGRWLNPVLCTLVVLLITGVCSAFQTYESVPNSTNAILGIIGLSLTFLVVNPLSFGYDVSFLQHVRGADVDDLVTRPFSAFKEYGRYLGTSLLMTIYLFLWALLLIVPAVIMGYAYAMTPYIMADHPELSPSECIAKSRQMMKGRKWKLFLLDLGFIGWMLLAIVTLGVYTLWLMPWITCSHVQFYEELKQAGAE